MHDSVVPAERPTEDAAQAKVGELISSIEQVIYGKHEVVKLCVVGLLARGHVLIEDVPGMGKTTLSQALARSIDCTFHRIQFTSDMLPSDIIGVSILDTKTNAFEFRPGPVFANIVLADEINRTPPKTQSALLEAMSEFHVTVEGKARQLPEPFMVMATQNPIEYEGTYTLPEAQLDRFLLRLEIGYPPADDEIRIMKRRDSHKTLESLEPVMTAEEIIALQEAAAAIHVEDSVTQYILQVTQATREHAHVQLGASPRGSLALYEACQAHALVEGRDFVTPGDVKTMAVPVLSHRLLVRSRGGNTASSARERARVIVEILKQVPLPV